MILPTLFATIAKPRIDVSRLDTGKDGFAGFGEGAATDFAGFGFHRLSMKRSLFPWMCIAVMKPSGLNDPVSMQILYPMLTGACWTE